MPDNAEQHIHNRRPIWFRFEWLAKYLLPSIKDLIFIAVFVLAIMLGPRMLNVDGDLGRHLTVGRYIIERGEIPTKDIFSHTKAGELFIPHEWLSEVIFAVVERFAGLDGVVILCGLILALSFSLIFGNRSQSPTSPLISLIIILIALSASSIHWLARPHLFSILFTVLWVRALDRLLDGERKALWVAPCLMLVWVNLHGAFLIGFLIWGIYLFGSLSETLLQANKNSNKKWKIRNLLLAGGGSILATTINPAGIRVWGVTLGYLSNQYLTGHTAEYLSPDFHSISVIPFLGMIIMVLFLFGLSRTRFAVKDILLVVIFMAAGLVSSRNIPLFAVISAPILGRMATGELKTTTRWAWLKKIDRRLTDVEHNLRGHLGAWIIVLVGFFLLRAGYSLDIRQEGNRFDPEVFPIQAVEWIKQNPPQGRMFNDFPWGGYLLNTLWPEYSVFIDGQTDFYGESLTREYEAVVTLQPGWEEKLEKYQVRWVIMPVESDLVSALLEKSSWELVYSDETAKVVFHEP